MERGSLRHGRTRCYSSSSKNNAKRLCVVISAGATNSDIGLPVIYLSSHSAILSLKQAQWRKDDCTLLRKCSVSRLMPGLREVAFNSTTPLVSIKVYSYGNQLTVANCHLINIGSTGGEKV